MKGPEMRRSFLVVLCLLAACSPSGEGDDAGIGLRAIDGGGGTIDSGSPDAGTDAGTSTQDAGPPAAPVLLAVSVVVHGTWRLTWMNPVVSCSAIDVYRNFNGGDFAKEQSVTGAATSTNDPAGHASGMYCYSLVCMRSAGPSAQSNAKCVSQ